MSCLDFQILFWFFFFFFFLLFLQVISELKAVFTETLAFDAYIPFCKLLGQFHMDEKLLNNDLLHEISVSNPNYVREKPSPSLQIPKPNRPLSGNLSSGLNRSQSARFEGAAQMDSADGMLLSRSFVAPSPLGLAALGMTSSVSEAEVICQE